MGAVAGDSFCAVNEVQVWWHEHIYSATLEKDELIRCAAAVKQHLL